MANCECALPGSLPKVCTQAKAERTGFEQAAQLPLSALRDCECKCHDQKPRDAAVDHPAHYGGDVPYEVIKVLDAWGLGFTLGNAVKYIARADHKGKRLEDLKKAAWYLAWEIERLEKEA